MNFNFFYNKEKVYMKIDIDLYFFLDMLFLGNFCL